jgi:GxxExxY protein
MECISETEFATRLTRISNLIHEKLENHEKMRRTRMPEIVFKEESYRIIGACFEVFKEMGSGFLEPVYQECLEMEFTLQSIAFKPQAELGLRYKGRVLQQKYIPDFVLYDKIVLEIKAARDLADVNRAQVHNYLKATGFRVGLLVNFGHHPDLQYERIVL